MSGGEPWGGASLVEHPTCSLRTSELEKSVSESSSNDSSESSSSESEASIPNASDEEALLGTRGAEKSLGDRVYLFHR